MRGRDGGRVAEGKDIGVWSVAIKGNLSYVVLRLRSL